MGMEEDDIVVEDVAKEDETQCNEWCVGVVKNSMATSRCLGCSCIIRWCKPHIYTYQLLYIPSRDIYFRRRLRYCPKLKCVRKDWTVRNSAHDGSNVENDTSIKLVVKFEKAISNEDMNSLKREGFEIIHRKE